MENNGENWRIMKKMLNYETLGNALKAMSDACRAYRGNYLHHFASSGQQKRDESAAIDLHGKMDCSLPRADSPTNGCDHHQRRQNAKG